MNKIHIDIDGKVFILFAWKVSVSVLIVVENIKQKMCLEDGKSTF